MRFVAMGAVLAGCIDSASVVCEHGRVCPAGDTCVEIADHDNCASADAIAACTDTSEGSACTVGGEHFTCLGGACITLCGNGSMDEGETCDDANRIAADGCSATCRVEGCGGGETDLFLGEQCDDSGLVSGDGCSSTCQLETGTWIVAAKEALTGRAYTRMVFDEAHNSLVLFGGIDAGGEPLADTWLWDMKTWRNVNSPDVPPGRFDQGMVFDSQRGRIVMFGGTGAGGGPLDDTWAWDGHAWQAIASGVHPPARARAQLAYDRMRDRVVLHGGSNGMLSVHDTWELGGDQWIEMHPTVTPGPPLTTGQVTLVYDRVRHVTVMAGESEPHTWTWDGTAWMDTGQFTPFTNQDESQMIWDPVKEQILFNGGSSSPWTPWTGSVWDTTVADSTNQSFEGVSLGFDGTVFVLFGGRSSATNYTTLMESWDRNGGRSWTFVFPRASSPGHLVDAAITYDVEAGRAIVVGGADGAPTSTVWAWTRDGWKTIAQSAGPSARSESTAAFDTDRRTVVVFGGFDGSTVIGDTWELDLHDMWTRVTLAGPPARSAASLVYDAARHRTLLFGGASTATTRFADTWTWDGATWTQLSPATSPSARSAAAIAYDPVRDRVVLFGGLQGNTADSITTNGETWEWDGATWQQIVTSTGPAPRQRAQMVWDPLRARIVLFGGDGITAFGDVWEWDGVAWTLRFTDLGTTRTRQATVFDTVRDGLVTVGGDSTILVGSGGGDTGDTLLLDFQGSAPREDCIYDDDRDGDGLAGCADPDCWGRCHPLCPPVGTCGSGASCGDGHCTDLEDAMICPVDCS